MASPLPECGVRAIGEIPDWGCWHEGLSRTVELICMEPRGHRGDHYDETYSRAWHTCALTEEAK